MTGQGSFWFGSTEFYPETINQSLRFNGDGDLRNSSFSTPTNNQQWTWSAWIKLGAIDSGLRVLFQADTNSVDVLQTNDNKLSLTVAGTAGTTTAKYRDPNAWYHVLFNYNGSNSYLYINNRLDLSLTTSGNSKINNSSYTHFIGQNGSNARYWSGYMAEVNFIDGQALNPSSFGETKNGVWIPKNVSSLTYGNNGFRLTFGNSSDLGEDSAGSNDFTVAGNLASYDIVLDSPTNNFATWNLLFKGGEQSSSIYANSTLSEGNLQVSVPTNSYMGSTFRPTSGKWYAEIRVKTLGASQGEVDWGWLQATTYSGTSGHSGQANKWGAYYHAYSTAHIRLYDETSQLGSNINLTISAGDILQLAWDIDNGKGWIGINNTYYAADNGTDGNPSAGTNQTFDFTADEAQNLQVYIANGTGTDVHVANFGQDGTFANGLTGGDVGTNTDANGIGAFKYAVPTGFLSCCSANLPDTTISPNQATQADDHFKTIDYDGDGQTTQDVTGVGFKPDWTWIKERESDGSHIANHVLVDSNRGYENFLVSSAIQAESSGITGNNSTRSNDGFQTTNSGASNQNNQDYVAWNWKANGGTTSSNTQGSKTVTVQANTTAGFSIITYSGDTSSFTLGHGLESAPKFIIVKSRTHSERWTVFHGADDQAYHYLNDTFARQTGNADERFGNSTSVVIPTDTLVTLGANNSDVSKNGENYVMYCFAEVDGYSRFGSYSGNNDSDGTFVYTGFRPAWVMFRRIDSGDNWAIFDVVRDTFNPLDSYIYADDGGAETEFSTAKVDYLSNGFKWRGNVNFGNTSGDYIYMAFAEQPFKFSNAR